MNACKLLNSPYYRDAFSRHCMAEGHPEDLEFLLALDRLSRIRGSRRTRTAIAALYRRFISRSLAPAEVRLSCELVALGKELASNPDLEGRWSRIAWRGFLQAAHNEVNERLAPASERFLQSRAFEALAKEPSRTEADIAPFWWLQFPSAALRGLQTRLRARC